MAIQKKRLRPSQILTLTPSEIPELDFLPQVRFKAIIEANVDWFIESFCIGRAVPPILVRTLADNSTLQGVDGRHRRLAAQRINKNPSLYDIPAEVSLRAEYQNLSDEEAIIAACQYNEGARPSPMDHAGTINLLQKTCGKSDVEIAKILKIQPGLVGLRKRYVHLEEEFQIRLHYGAIPETVARTLLTSDLSPEEIKQAQHDLLTDKLKPHELKAKVNKRKRDQGKRAVRGVGELLTLLKDLSTVSSVTLYRWIQGDPAIPTELVEPIFAGENVDLQKIIDEAKPKPPPKPPKKSTGKRGQPKGSKNKRKSTAKPATERRTLRVVGEPGEGRTDVVVEGKSRKRTATKRKRKLQPIKRPAKLGEEI